MHHRRASWVGLALLAGLALAGCESQPVGPYAAPAEEPPVTLGDPAGDIARGEQALAAGRYSEARSAFAAALQVSSNDPGAAIGLAEAYLALGQRETAAELLGLAAPYASGGYRGRLLQALGILTLETNQMAEAEQYFRDAIRTDQGLWRAWLGLGRVQAASGDQDGALAAFVEAERQAPQAATVQNDMGMFFLTAQRPKEAIPRFEKALALAPDHAVAEGNLRIARALAGDYDVAIAGAAQAELADVLNNAGYAAMLNGDVETADRLLRRALEVSPIFHQRATANLDLLAKLQGSTAQQRVAAAATRQIAGTIATGQVTSIP